MSASAPWSAYVLQGTGGEGQSGPAWRPPQWNTAQLTSLTASEPDPNDASQTVQTTYFFDAVLRLVHSQQLAVTAHPVQTGAPIVDHAFLMPAKVILSIGMSDAMESYNPAAYSGGPKSVSAYNTFLSLQASRNPLTLTTRLRTYTNMLIEAVEAIDDHRTVTGLRALITLIQIIPAQVSVATEPLPAQSQRDQTSETTNDGTLQTSPAPQSLVDSNTIDQFINQTTVNQFGTRTVDIPGAGTFALDIPGAGRWSSFPIGTQP